MSYDDIKNQETRGYGLSSYPHSDPKHDIGADASEGSCVNGSSSVEKGDPSADDDGLQNKISALNSENPGYFKPLARPDLKNQFLHVELQDGEQFSKEIFISHLRAIVDLARDYKLKIPYQEQTKLCQAFGLPTNVYSDNAPDIDELAEALIRVVEKDGENMSVLHASTKKYRGGDPADSVSRDAKSFVEREFTSSPSRSPKAEDGEEFVEQDI